MNMDSDFGFQFICAKSKNKMNPIIDSSVRPVKEFRFVGGRQAQ